MGKFTGVLIASDFDNTLVFTENALKGLEPMPELLPENRCIVTLRQGKFHQVKRMLAACGAPVLYLKRLSMGPLTLPDDLPPGAYRLLTDEEISALYRVCAM